MDLTDYDPFLFITDYIRSRQEKMSTLNTDVYITGNAGCNNRT